MEEPSMLLSAILNGDAKAAASFARQVIHDGIDSMELVTHHMIPAMDEVGRLVEGEGYFVPALLLSGRAMKAALEIVHPAISIGMQNQ